MKRTTELSSPLEKSLSHVGQTLFVYTALSRGELLIRECVPKAVAMRNIDRDQIALGVKQPWAELILRGTKTLEIRSRPTHVRGRIYLYTSKKIARENFALQALQTYQLNPESFPTGLLVGSVEIIGCRKANADDEQASCVPAEKLVGCFAWELSQPQRLAVPLPVRFLPYGVWFYPFKRRQK